MKNVLFRALSNAADGAFVIDHDRHILYWNHAAQEIVGYAYTEVAGRACYEIMAGCDEQNRPICHAYCGVAVLALNGGPVTDFDVCVYTKSGHARWINVSTFAAPAEAEEANLVLVHLFRDVTHRKQNELFLQRLVQAVRDLQVTDLSQASRPGSTEDAVTDLTDRERQVLSLLARGSSTRDIAQALSISPSTARNHIRNILQKLHVHSRLEAVVEAHKHGLVSEDR